MAALIINVTSPAGPDVPDNPIYLLATEPLVAGTPFLDWRPAPAGAGGAAQVSLATFQALRAFITRARISRVPADLAAAQAVHALTVRLHDACWSRIFSELMAADILANMPTDVASLWDAMATATYPTPANLDIVAGDWRATQAFVIPAGNGVAAVATRADLTPLRFLSLVTVDSMEDAAGSLPLEGLCILIGALGPCQTQASRRVETSSVQLTAATILMNIPNGQALSDGQLAVKVIAFVKGKRLPVQLRPAGVGEVELREELENGIEYRRSDEGRRAIEEKCIFNLGRRYFGLVDSVARHAVLLPAKAALLARCHRFGGTTWPGGRSFSHYLRSALIHAPPTFGSMLIAHHPRECTQACTTRIRECAYPHATLGVRLSACHPRSGA